MKKVFLLFSIAASSSASAQQQELFDIQNHIGKKQIEGKNAAKKISLPYPLLRSFNL